MTEDDLKKELRKAHGTACYLCLQLQPRTKDVVAMLFQPGKVEEPGVEDVYLCCKSCAAKIRNRPISAYATEQLARIATERVRLEQLSQWHNVHRNTSPLAPSDGIIRTFKGPFGGTYVRGLDKDGDPMDLMVVPPADDESWDP